MPLKIEIDLRISAALIHNQVWFLHTNKSYLELRNGRLTEDDHHDQLNAVVSQKNVLRTLSNI